MKVTTALDHQDRYQRRLHELYGMARFYSWTHAELLAEIRERIYDDPSYKRCPSWVHTGVVMVGRVLSDQLYQTKPPDNEIAWVLYENGERVDREKVQDWSKVKGRHEWTKTGKPFSMLREARRRVFRNGKRYEG